MTVPAPPQPPRSPATTPVVAMVVYTLRTCLPGRRRWGLALPCVAAVVFGLLSRLVEGDAGHNFADMAGTALFGLVLPITALVVGDAVLGAEVRRGSFTFTWLSPVPAWQVVLARWVGGSAVAGVSLAVAFALSAVAAGAPEHAAAAAIAAAFGSVAYVAVFMAIGAIARRAAVWSLAFVFLFERLLGAALSAIAQLSPSWEARAAFLGLIDAPYWMTRSGMPHGDAALLRLVAIAAVALVIASIRLPHLRMAGSSD